MPQDWPLFSVLVVCGLGQARGRAAAISGVNCHRELEELDIARPDQGFAPSTTLRELFLGHITRVYGAPGQVPPGRYAGDYGFTVEYPNAGVKG